MKIGQFVRQYTPAIFEYCETQDPGELARLQDAHYCQRTFDINFPFCTDANTIDDALHRRYWTALHTVGGVQVRVTNHWYNPPTSESYPRLRRYLRDRGIIEARCPRARL